MSNKITVEKYLMTIKDRIKAGDKNIDLDENFPVVARQPVKVKIEVCDIKIAFTYDGSDKNTSDDIPEVIRSISAYLSVR